MTKLTTSERLKVAALQADRSRRSLLSRVFSLPMMQGRPPNDAMSDQLLLVPQNLRPADPIFWQEVRGGRFGLAGSVAGLNNRSPFEVLPPTGAWARALHGFGWLHHMHAARNVDAREAALSLVLDWIARHPRRGSGFAWQPAVIGRRIISWISHSDYLLGTADIADYDTFTTSLGGQIADLNATWREAPQGYHRLLALLALMFADLCVAGHEQQFAGVERAFCAELERQILPDGGHISRNSDVLMDLLLDVLPLTQCYASRSRTPPPVLANAAPRMLLMLRYMRLGDGRLARFNGVGVPSAATLATVLAYDDPLSPGLAQAPNTKYLRVACGESILLCDVGSPPPLEVAGEAHAGCLSFEMSSGKDLLFVNSGAPGRAHADWRPAARATASHTTLCMAETSSSRLVRDPALEALIGAPPIRFPSLTSATVKHQDTGVTVELLHNGYVEEFGLVHYRTLTLDATGRHLTGHDRIEQARGRRVPPNTPFAIHFHVPPSAECYHAKVNVAAEVLLRNQEQWRFTVVGAKLSIEESTHYGGSAGPRPSLQIVLRGMTSGEADVRWSVDQRD